MPTERGGQERVIVATRAITKAIWPKAMAVPRLVAPASSATPVAPANAARSTVSCTEIRTARQHSPQDPLHLRPKGCVTPASGVASSVVEAQGIHSAELTVRERDVLERLAEGWATEEIAEFLCVSPHTVRSRVKTLLRKLGARNREHAVAIALRNDVIDPKL
jgi:DNA-binding NarL/FixJ family response regulator